ncbi:MAG: DUF1700 domain-containing protein [Lachnospiraceae bacterium]|nr:DUF1700 domain-containing protein [Lachnospiraceae bacterium]
MTKEEFLDELRSSLSGSVSADVINENLNYYENFINIEIRKGRDADEVLSELGSPRLLAKTIIDTAPAHERRTVDAGPDDQSESPASEDSFIMPWWMILIVIFGLIAAVILFFTIASAVLPVVIIIAVIFFVIRVLGKGR